MYTFTGIVASAVVYGTCTPLEIATLINASIEDVELALVHLLGINFICQPIASFNMFVVSSNGQTLKRDFQTTQLSHQRKLRKRLKQCLRPRTIAGRQKRGLKKQKKHFGKRSHTQIKL